MQVFWSEAKASGLSIAAYMCALSQIENAPQRQSVNVCLVLGYWGEKKFCRILVANLVAGGGSTREENVQQWANIKNTDKNLPSSILMEK